MIQATNPTLPNPAAAPPLSSGDLALTEDRSFNQQFLERLPASTYAKRETFRDADRTPARSEAKPERGRDTEGIANDPQPAAQVTRNDSNVNDSRDARANEANSTQDPNSEAPSSEPNADTTESDEHQATLPEDEPESAEGLSAQQAQLLAAQAAQKPADPAAAQATSQAAVQPGANLASAKSNHQPTNPNGPAHAGSSPVLTAAANEQAFNAPDTGNSPQQQNGDASDTTRPAPASNPNPANAAAPSAFNAAAQANANANDAAGPIPSNQNANANAPQNAAAPNLAPTTQGTDALNEARLTRGLKSALNQQGGTVTLRLTPPEMGTVRIQMQLQGTAVAAQFHAETDNARALLQQQLGQLRTALESQGLSVERLGVQTMSQSSAGQGSTFNHNGQQGQDPNANPDGRSRGFNGQSSQQQQRNDQPDPQAAPETFDDLVHTIS